MAVLVFLHNWIVCYLVFDYVWNRYQCANECDNGDWTQSGLRQRYKKLKSVWNVAPSRTVIKSWYFLSLFSNYIIQNKSSQKYCETLASQDKDVWREKGTEACFVRYKGNNRIMALTLLFCDILLVVPLFETKQLCLVKWLCIKLSCHFYQYNIRWMIKFRKSLPWNFTCLAKYV